MKHKTEVPYHVAKRGYIAVAERTPKKGELVMIGSGPRACVGRVASSASNFCVRTILREVR
jgi:hypothetical protein